MRCLGQLHILGLGALATTQGWFYPTNSVASGGVFLLLFSLFFPKALLSSAMLLSRGVSFYLFVFVSVVFLAFDLIRTNLRAHRLRLDDDDTLGRDARVAPCEQARLHILGQRGRRNVEAQMHRTRDLVDVLPARALGADRVEAAFLGPWVAGDGITGWHHRRPAEGR